MACMLNHVQLFVIPWTVAHQAPLSVEFFKQEYQAGLPFPPPGDLPDPGIEPWSPTLQTDYLPSEPPGRPQATLCMSQGSLEFLFSPSLTLSSPLFVSFCLLNTSQLPLSPPSSPPHHLLGAPHWLSQRCSASSGLFSVWKPEGSFQNTHFISTYPLSNLSRASPCC